MTIYAVSSGQPPAAIAIVRISGARAMAAARTLAGRLPPPRTAAVRRLTAPGDGALLDHALVLCFPGPASATGEDLVELHLHGGRAVIVAVLGALAALPGLRPAIAGEFTRRALMNGRIDLAEAEGLGDLLAAETEGQRRAAMAAADGVVSRAVAGWSDGLLAISATIEAMLDFADEEDVSSAPPQTTERAIAALAADIGAVLEAPAIERLHHGIQVVLAGPPNSGKSTLFNAMVDRDAAIVSPIAGTTRDKIEATITRGGIAYVLIDTAGLAGATDDPIEAIGIERAQHALAGADILLWLGEATPPARSGPTIWLLPRCDQRTDRDDNRLAVSGQNGEGIPSLWDALESQAMQLLPRPDQLALNARQRALCGEARDALLRGLGQTDMLIVAEELRLARQALDRITGATDVEAMLDGLFGRFCIGK